MTNPLRSASSNTRLVRSISIVGLAFFLLWICRQYVITRLGNEAFATGYTLLGTCLCLCLLGIRKRYPKAAFGPVAYWQAAHHYLGIFCLLAYVLHAGLLTTGWLESSLAILFWTILLTGFLSWYVNQTSPRLLRAAGQAILRSDIPEARLSIASEAYTIAIEAAGRADSCVLADLYRTRLNRFFSSNRSLWYRLLPSGYLRRELQSELDGLSRYLDEKGLGLQRRMSELVKLRDDLDFQSAVQNRIRFCAAIHTCLLGSFIVVTAAHIVLALLYSSHW